MRLVYLVSEYPKVSHSFIRREILALEERGFTILRVAMRGWDAPLPDGEDGRERERTRYLLGGGLLPLALAVARTLLLSPRKFFAALGLALRMARQSDRSVLYHLVYLAEACLLLAWAREHGAARIHVHFATNATDVAMLASVLGGPPFSFMLHGTAELDRLPYLCLPEKAQRADLVMAASLFMRSQVLRAIPDAEWPKVHVVRCGLERRFYETGQSPPPAAPRLVCAGRFSREKGHLLLLEAARQLAAGGAVFELVLAGDGPLRPRLEEMIRVHGLSDRVRITGWISSSRMREEMQAARALVLPSFSEGLPVVVMEAMALGRPVIATSVGGMAELVRPENGWLIPPASVSALADAIGELLAMPRERLALMAEAARARVLEQHSIERESEALARLFRQGVA